jgi:hypothetical protein
MQQRPGRMLVASDPTLLLSYYSILLTCFGDRPFTWTWLGCSCCITIDLNVYRWAGKQALCSGHQWCAQGTGSGVGKHCKLEVTYQGQHSPAV